jgi:type I restriction enzyme S subunit
MNKGHIKDMDILLYKDGGRPGEFEPHLTMFGRGFPYEKCAINEHVYRMRADNTLGQCFLYFWLSSDLLMGEMRIRGTGVAIPGLNSTQVKSLTTLFPSPKILQDYDKLARPLVERVLEACSESRTLAALRDTLLPKLISGELRVKAAETFLDRVL